MMSGQAICTAECSRRPAARNRLLPLPAVGDNAAMEDKPKRRWYQFSLRTLLIVVTLVCVVAAGWPYNAAMLGYILTILMAIALTVFMLGAPLWPWLMRRHR
jgi:hypothetical protein